MPPQQLRKTGPFTDDIFIKAFEVLDRNNWTREELIAYEKSVDAERVRRSELETAEENGQEKERKAIAKNLLAQNLAIEAICMATGLSEQEVEALKKK